jgi:hypothetical protein
MAGESADADEKAEDFIVNVLPGLIEGYVAETYGFSNEKCHGGNKSDLQ